MKQLLKYILTFIITLLILATIQNLVLRIPNTLIEKNIKESSNYLYEEGERPILLKNSNKYLKEVTRVDNVTDSYTLNMIWNNTANTQIQMNYYFNGTESSKSLYKTVHDNKKPNEEYSRYWQGSMIYIKPLLIFFNIKEIKIINYIILSILTIILVYLLFKKNKLLSVSTIIGLLSIAIFLVPNCFGFYFMFLITTIVSLITLKLINKEEKYFIYLMIISGVVTNFLDFLSCETLSLTIPLFIYIFLKYNKKKFETKKVLLFMIKSILAWGLSYVLSFLIKWLLAIIVYGPKEFSYIWNRAKIRIYDIPIPGSKLAYILGIILNIFSCLLPFSSFSSSSTIIIIFLIFISWIYIFNISKKRKRIYNLLLLISIIPIIRFIVLYAHSIVHIYFVYRALLPLCILIVIIIYEGIIKKFIKYIKKSYNN